MAGEEIFAVAVKAAITERGALESLRIGLPQVMIWNAVHEEKSLIWN